MRKVLIVAYAFPPSRAIGAQRPYRLAKYISKYGWEPIILTPGIPGDSPSEISIVKTDYNDIIHIIKSKIGLNPDKSMHEQLGIDVKKKSMHEKSGIEVSDNQNGLSWKSKFIKVIKEILLFPDDKKAWYSFAYNAGSHLLETQNIDAIISTSPPIISHLIASKLKIKYNVKWIADFRDPWSRIDRNDLKMIKYFDNKLEQKTISKADVLVSVTKPYVDFIKALHPDKKVELIPNGFDPIEYKDLTTKLTNKFTITYAGKLYNGKRDPGLLFKSIEQLIEENKINKKLVEIRFYCPKESWLLNEIEKHNLKDVVNLCGFVSRTEVLNKQKESQLLLLIRWSTKFDKGDCPAKIYEYMGVRRPIIAIGGYGGIVQALLKETNAGRFADNVNALKNIVLDYYREFIKLGEAQCKSNNNIKNYSYEIIAKEYSMILNKISGRDFLNS